MKYKLIVFILFFSHLQTLSAADHNKKPTQIKFTSINPTEGNLILGVYSDQVLGSFGKSLDSNTDQKLSYLIKTSKFEAKEKTSQLIIAPEGSGFSRILLVGLGESSNAKTNLEWQEIGGKSFQDAKKTFKKELPLFVFDVNDDSKNNQPITNIAYGAKLSAYYFDKYYTAEDKQKYQKQINIYTPEAKLVSNQFKNNLNHQANAIWFTRDISNEPANVIYPESFVQTWTHHFKNLSDVKIKVLDEKDMLRLNMGAIYGVGRGSKRPPRMMIVEYMGGSKNEQPVVIVGKGITFDTGGISLKPPTNMWNMKFDMSGAASTMGTLYTLAATKAKVNVIAIAALAENMPGANAQRPGDVVTSMSGKTIQIRSTDAEGRLVLADGLYYGDITYDPKIIINLATLTGSARRALGSDYAALFTRHQELASPFIETGKLTGDRVWQLPLDKSHFKAIENKVADVMNSGPDAPGASAGAAFLGTFVRESTPWVHFDIAGAAYTDKVMPLKSSPGSTSFGVSLLTQYIQKNHAQD